MSEITKRSPASKKRWDGRFKSRVMQMIQIASSGGDQVTPMRRAANCIEQEYGGIERLIGEWVRHVKAMCDKDHGSVRAVNAQKELFRVWASLHEAEAKPDFTAIEDHDTFQAMFTAEAFLEAVEKDNFLLFDIVMRIPEFNPAVIVEIAKHFDLTLITPDTIDV